MIRFRYLRPLIGSFFLVAPFARGELRLFAEFDGRRAPISRVDARSVYVAGDQGDVAVPPDASWSIEGDARENAADILWARGYAISTRDLPDCQRATTDFPIVGIMGIDHTPGAVTLRKVNGALELWPTAASDPSVLVMAWFFEGKLVSAYARPVPGVAAGKKFSVHHEFRLKSEWARGQGVFLLWTNGHFVAAAPWFKEPAEQRAMLAALWDDEAGLRRALTQGVSAKAMSRDRMTLLQFAAEAGATHAVQLLCAAGARVDAGNGGSALARAAQTGRAEVVRLLLNAGANPDGATDGDHALHRAIADGHPDIALQLIAAGADVRLLDAFRRIPIVPALNAGMCDVVEALLAKGSPVVLDSDQSDRVLITQAQLGHTAMVRFLLQHGAHADYEARNVTALVGAATHGDPVLARLLLAAGAKADHITADGNSPLAMATVGDRDGFAAALLEAGANPDVRLRNGLTALHFAAARNASKVTAVLLEHGANADLRVNGTSPLDLALDAEARESAALLAERGAKIDVRGPLANRRLERAIILDLPKLVGAAINDGWSPRTKFNDRWPALAVAELCRATGCAQVLVEAGAKAEADAPELASAAGLDRKPAPVRIVPPTDPRDPDDHVPSADVVVEAVIDVDGSVQLPHVVNTPGHSLAASALGAVRRWTISPALAKGHPVPIKIQLPVGFPSTERLAYDTWQVDTPPEPLQREMPKYPDEMRDKGYVGSVELTFIINAEGHTERIRVLSSSHPAFDEAAVKAVHAWTFKPALLNGKPVPARMRFPLLFMIRGVSA